LAQDHAVAQEAQLHAAAVTIEGLTAISRDMNVFYIPLLVQSFEELDFIRSNLLDDLTEDLDSQGFMILGWADVGWAYWFSRKPILTPEDLKDLRLFSWAGDYRWVELWKKAGFHPVPLASVDLLPSLQTGLVDAFATAPMVALSKQWFGPAPHMLDLKWGPMIGAIIISTKMWESIPAAYHPLLLEIARETEIRARDLLPLVQEALDVMNEYGLQIHRPSGDQQKAWIDLTHAFYPDIRGVLVPEEVFDRAIELKREWDERKRGTPEAPSPGN
ncbi:MAG: TRAP transporter substrate-binding protein DctP, partial [Fidelibacterota bacterium]